ncbi:MAG: hypothetical protein WDN31_11745 [Hyphomicrobium sp.]
MPDAPAGTDANHRLPLTLIAEAKLIMTDALLNMAPELQEDPLLDDPEIETIEDAGEEDADELDIETVEDPSTQTEEIE